MRERGGHLTLELLFTLIVNLKKKKKKKTQIVRRSACYMLLYTTPAGLKVVAYRSSIMSKKRFVGWSNMLPSSVLKDLMRSFSIG